MPYSEADTGSSRPCLGKKEQIVSECVSLMIRTMVSYYSGENGDMSSVLTG